MEQVGTKKAIGGYEIILKYIHPCICDDMN